MNSFKVGIGGRGCKRTAGQRWTDGDMNGFQSHIQENPFRWVGYLLEFPKPEGTRRREDGGVGIIANLCALLSH